jgi:hypothetical protein
MGQAEDASTAPVIRVHRIPSEKSEPYNGSMVGAASAPGASCCATRASGSLQQEPFIDGNAPGPRTGRQVLLNYLFL